MQPFPVPDFQRIDRVVQDVADLLQLGEEPDEASKRKIKRWIEHVLRKAKIARSWWFLENMAPATLEAGQDLIDLKGHIDRVSAVYAGGERLLPMTLEEVTLRRQEAAARQYVNGGCPTHYALEAGRRLHLWPCPTDSTPFAVVYQRPIHIALLPDEWEAILLDGVLGMYGRHFDRKQLAHTPQEFERRWLASLRGASIDSHDTHIMRTWREHLPARSTVAAQSAMDEPTTFLMPASLTGVGFEMVLDEGGFLQINAGNGMTDSLGLSNGESLAINDGSPPDVGDYQQSVT